MPRDPDAQDWLARASAAKSWETRRREEAARARLAAAADRSSRQPSPRPAAPSQSVWERMKAFGEETQRVERMMAFGEQTRRQEAANRMAAAFGGLPRSVTGTAEERRASSFGALPVPGAVYGAAAVRAEQERRRTAEEPIYRGRSGRGRPPPTVGLATVMRTRLERYYAAGDAPAPPYPGDGGYYYPRYSSRGGGYSGGEEVKGWLNNLYSWDI